MVQSVQRLGGALGCFSFRSFRCPEMQRGVSVFERWFVVTIVLMTVSFFLFSFFYMTDDPKLAKSFS
jgi:hypothetical protein